MWLGSTCSHQIQAPCFSLTKYNLRCWFCPVINPVLSRLCEWCTAIFGTNLGLKMHGNICWHVTEGRMLTSSAAPGTPKNRSTSSSLGLQMLWGTTKVKADGTRGSNRPTNIQTPNSGLLLSLSVLIVCPFISFLAKRNCYGQSEISSEFQICKWQNATPCHRCLQPHAAVSTSSLLLCLQSSFPPCPTFACVWQCLPRDWQLGSIQGEWVRSTDNPPSVLFQSPGHILWAKGNIGCTNAQAEAEVTASSITFVNIFLPPRFFFFCRQSVMLKLPPPSLPSHRAKFSKNCEGFSRGKELNPAWPCLLPSIKYHSWDIRSTERSDKVSNIHTK